MWEIDTKLLNDKVKNKLLDNGDWNNKERLIHHKKCMICALKKNEDNEYYPILYNFMLSGINLINERIIEIVEKEVIEWYIYRNW